MLLFITGSLAQCTNPYERPSWRTLPEATKQEYLSAIQALKKRGPSNGPMENWNYDQFVSLHYKQQEYAHAVPAFLPWHRRFILEYEKALQSVGFNSPLPYWDWSLDSQNPSKADVFLPQYFGGNGDSGNRCVNSGKFANWRISVPEPRCLTRCFQFSKLWSPEMVAGNLNNADTYDEVRKSIEGGPHAPVHSQIGGTVGCGDMSTMHSTNDPLFFMHHANIDRLWWKWQMACKDRITAYEGNDASPSDIMAGFNEPVSSVLSTTANGLCYKYGPSSSDNIAIFARKCSTGEVTGPGAPVAASTTISIPMSKPTIESNLNIDWFTPAIVNLLSVNRSASVAVKKRGLETFSYPSLPTITVVSESLTITATKTNVPTATKAAIKKGMPKYVPGNITVVAPKGIKDPYHIGHPEYVPQDWIKYMGLDPYLVRKLEIEARYIADEINNQNDYISEAALINFNKYNPHTEWKFEFHIEYEV